MSGARDLGLGAGRSVGRAARATGSAVARTRITYAKPEEAADYGPVPEHYAELVRRHFELARGYPPTAGFLFDALSRAYMNAGLLRGGGVVRHGYVVGVCVETPARRGTETRSERFVVRLRDREVVDVHAGDGALVHREPLG